MRRGRAEMNDGPPHRLQKDATHHLLSCCAGARMTGVIQGRAGWEPDLQIASSRCLLLIEAPDFSIAAMS